jgi:hypothetical protein
MSSAGATRDTWFPGPDALRMTFDWILAAIAGGILAILLDVVLARAAAWVARVRRRL